MQQIIDWFEIPVRDITSAQNFYETVLQTRLHREEYAGPGMQMAVFAGEGDVVKGALMSGHPALQVGACGTLVYLHAGASLEAALQRVGRCRRANRYGPGRSARWLGLYGAYAGCGR